MGKIFCYTKNKYLHVISGLLFAFFLLVLGRMDVSAAVVTAPSNVHQVEADYINPLRFTWNAARSDQGKAITYIWEISKDRQFTNPVRRGTSGSVEVAGCANLSYGTDFYLRVGAVETSADGGVDEADIRWSAIVSLTSPPACTIEGLRQTGATASSITVAWKSVWDVKEYEVSYYKGSDTTAMKKKYTKNTSLKLTGLKAGCDYTIAVRGVRTSGTFKAVSPNQTTLYATTVAGKVTGFKAVRYKKNAIDFYWNGNELVDSYRIAVTKYTDPGFKHPLFTYATYQQGNSDTVRNHKIKNGEFYLARIQPCVRLSDGSYAYGAWSSAIQFGSDPKSVKTVQKGSNIKVSWSKVKGATGYEIYAAREPFQKLTKVTTVKSSTKSYLIKKIGKQSVKTRYLYSVRIVPVRKQGSKTYRTPGDEAQSLIYLY